MIEMSMSKFRQESSYDPLVSEEQDFENRPSDTNRSDASLECLRAAGASKLWLRLSAAFNIALLMVIAAGGTGRYWERWVMNQNLRKCSSYSPIHDLIDLAPQVKTINGSFFPSQDQSIGRQMPNDEADGLWNEWSIGRIHPLTREDIIKMGKDPSVVVKLDDAIWGLGDNAYAASLDVYHQLHCLNTLRHIAYGSYYNKSMADASLAKPSLKEIHLNHCVDILVQALQCSANVNFITMDWVETQKHPFPDMSVNRKCIDFNKLSQWRLENSLDMDRFYAIMKKPKEVKQRPMADEYYAYYGSKSPNHSNGSNKDADFVI